MPVNTELNVNVRSRSIRRDMDVISPGRREPAVRDEPLTDTDRVYLGMFTRQMRNNPWSSNEQQQRIILGMGHAVLPILKEAFIDSQTTHSGEHSSLPYAFSLYARALARPGDEQMLMDVIETPAVRLSHDGSAMSHFRVALNNIIYQIRTEDPHDSRLGHIAERLYSIRERGFVNSAATDKLMDPLALTGHESISNFIQAHATPYILRFFDNADALPDYDRDNRGFTWQGRERAGISPERARPDEAVRQSEVQVAIEAQERFDQVLEREAQQARLREERREQERITAEQARTQQEKLRIERVLQFTNGLPQEAVENFVDAIAKVNNKAGKLLRFGEVVHTLLPSLSELSIMKRRSVASDVITMLDLVVNGKLDKKYKRYVKNLEAKEEAAPKTPAEVRAAKVGLAMDHVARIRNINKEAGLPDEPITFGLELEWDGRKDKGNSTLSELALLGTFDLGKDNEFAAGYKTDELQTATSASPRMQMRELIILHEAGALQDGWNIHNTLGGVFLSPNHTEVMDITAMSAAAGFLPTFSRVVPTFDKTTGRFSQKVTLKTEICAKDSYGFDPDNNWFQAYFPFHKNRNPVEDEIEIYYPDQSELAVERRSSHRFPKGTFPQFAKDADFAFRAAWGIRAVQRDPEHRTALDEELLTAWETLQSGWNQLLVENSLKNPTDKERMTKNANEKCGYRSFLSDVGYKGSTDKTFRKKVRTLIAQHNKTVGKLINY